MKDAIAILPGGGPAPGMNTVVGSVAKTFLRQGYRVIGLHEGYTGLFNPSPRTVDIDYPMADGIFNQGGSFLQMSRFKPKDSDFENNFNLKFFTDNNIKLLLSVPFDNIDALWFDQPLNPCVKLIACDKGGDYFDAIYLSDLALKGPGFYAEGGAKNIARRDGMACTVLSAVTTIGRIPDYYFQAVGSGTGAIAAWEANMRLNEDGRFGNKTMNLVVSQNAPFGPMFDAWRGDSREMLPYEAANARRDAEIIDAKVLSNRKPPYSLAGGLYDALKATGGDIMVATNAQARKARALFEETEGIDIYSAAGIATASLVKPVADGRIDPEKIVMLNITGGGEHRCQQDKELWYLEPSLVFPLTPDPEEGVAKTEALFD